MSEQQPWTILRLLQWTTDYLKQHGAESPRLDAEVLLAHARGCPRIQLYTCFDQEADEPLREAFRALVRQRAQGMPVAYLVGHREFYSLDFEVTRDVLIPRPETEFLVVALLDLAKRAGTIDEPLRVIDVGTGSGVLAICAAKYLNNADVYAVDISPPALEVAQRNAERHQVRDRIRFSTSDLMQSIPGDLAFDFILSNPPYIAESARATMSRDVLNFEPETALFAGENGLDVLERLLEQAAERLAPGGWLLAEFSPEQKAPLADIAARLAVFEEPEFTTDLSHQARVLMLQRKSV